MQKQKADTSLCHLHSGVYHLGFFWPQVIESLLHGDLSTTGLAGSCNENSQGSMAPQVINLEAPWPHGLSLTSL